MKRVLPLLPALLALSLLAGCSMIVTSPARGEIQSAMDEALDEARNDLEDSLSGLDEDIGAFDAAWDELFDSLEEDEGAKAHRWQILDARGEELLTVSDEDGVAAIDALLQDDGWSFSGGKAGEALYTYVFWQEKTLLAGQDPKAEREYEALIRFTIPAEGNTVTMRILPQSLDGIEVAGLDLDDLLTVNGEAPAEALEALRNPDQWGK